MTSDVKKIVFVIESLHCGGAEKSLVTLLQSLDYSKYKIDLIITVDNGNFQKFVPKEVTVKLINVFSGLTKYNIVFLRFLFLIRKKLNWKNKYHPAQLYWKTFGSNIKSISDNYDIAIAYNQGFSTYFVADKVKSNIKYAWLNTDYKIAGYNINFDHYFYKKYNKVICVSKENKISFESELLKLNTTINSLIIKDITDANIIVALSSDNDGFQKNSNIIILTVGRLAKAKGLNLAIAACSLLLKKGYKLSWFIIGEGPEREKLELLIAQNNLQKHFYLLGYKENPYPYIKSCDIYTQTSLFEGLGLTVIEAAILQKPIVTTNFPTASSIIKHNETGLICNMTPIDIADSIEKYIIDKDLKNRIVKNLSLTTNNDKEISLKKIDELLNS